MSRMNERRVDQSHNPLRRRESRRAKPTHSFGSLRACERLEQRLALTVELSGAPSVAEGSLYTLTLGGTPSAGAVEYLVHWGDGATATVPAANGTLDHTYADGPNDFDITVEELDVNGDPISGGDGSLASDELAVSIGDMALATATTATGTVALALTSDIGFAFLTFDADGVETSRVPINFGALEPLAGLKIAVDQSGNILLAGSVIGVEGTDFAVSRYAPDGTLDATYSVSLGTIDEVALGVAVDSQDRIILSGYLDDNLDFNFDVAVVRLLSNGNLDTSFGVSGVATADLGGDDRGQAVAIAPDDSIVVIMRNAADSAILRFSESGTWDSTVAIVEDANFAWRDASYASVAVDSQNRILLGGVTSVNGDLDFAIARYTPAGVLDATFDGDGIFVVPGVGQDEETWDVAVDSLDRILALGNRLGSDLLLVRIEAEDGTPPTPLSITVDNENPIAAPHALAPTEDAPLALHVLAGVYDPGTLDTHTAVPASFTTSLGGVVTILLDGTATYNPAGQFEYLGVGETALDSFTYAVTDSDGGVSALATVSVTIHGVNDAPVANADAYSVTEDGVLTVSAALGVRANDTDADINDALTIAVLAGPANGTLVLNANGSFTYTPGTSGDDPTSDSFTYTVSDGQGGTAIGSVAIAITPAVAPGAVVRTGNIVRVGGTSGSNNIVLTKVGSLLYLNGSSTGVSLTGATQIRVWGREGNDVIVLSGLSINTYVHGGAGSDIITGGSASDLIFGGSGSDLLTGGNGNDFLIGGGGQDLLLGGTGNDILVAGDVDTTDSADALFGILAQWGNLHIADESLTDDVVDSLASGGDILSGASGSDWFIVGSGDLILDLPWNRGGDYISRV